ncbi:maker528 [Drosophila busckii]|uniref:Maker528 n=1 Tax=Drosophila busckii TaxID=30019 RepID=A0A0M5IZ41_DROBS|nr:maker528 [Drosophila busckii]
MIVCSLIMQTVLYSIALLVVGVNGESQLEAAANCISDPYCEEWCEIESCRRMHKVCQACGNAAMEPLVVRRSRAADDAFEGIGNKYYLMKSTPKLNWFAAAHKCHSLGAHLVNISNRYQLEAISRSLQKTTGLVYWIDVNDLKELGVYSSLTTGYLAYTLWTDAADDEDNAPDLLVRPASSSDKHRCAQLFLNESNLWRMILANCDSTAGYICEKKLKKEDCSLDI